MSKRVRSGFKLKVKGIDAMVYFKTSNERVVQCFIVDYTYGVETWEGKAVCNVNAGDIFDERYGMGLAFQRAMNARTKPIMVAVEQMRSDAAFAVCEGNRLLLDKLVRGKIRAYDSKESKK